jgi:tRNA threonylcarbamoyladenosine biosynthesis protein TsaB
MLLAIDSATRKIGIALYDGVEVVHEAVWHSPSYHTVELTSAIEAAMERAGVGVEDLEAIGVAIGPGSYTGLRIGAAVAKGLSLARRLPLVGVFTFDILAAAQPVLENLQLAVVLEAGRGRLAIGWFKAKDNAWHPAGKPDLFTPMELSRKIRKPTVICGELSEDVRKILRRKRKNAIVVSPAHSLRRPAFLAELAWERWRAGEVDNPAEIAPFYLHTGENVPA